MKVSQQARTAKEVMQDAHSFARNIVGIVGDYRIAFTIAIRLAWRFHKEGVRGIFFTDWAMREIEPESVYGVPTWAIKKDFYASYERREILFFTESVEVLSETAKAVKMAFHINETEDDYKYDGPITRIAWVAKSIMVKD